MSGKPPGEPTGRLAPLRANRPESDPETSKQKVTFDRGRFWYDANGITRAASDDEIASEFVRLQDRLRAAEAQKERCAGMTAGEWRTLFIKTQDQWEAAKAEIMLLRSVKWQR